jgi:hypothetical protein
MKTPWNEERDCSWRWLPAFAWHPVKTFDAGWIFFKAYWRYQKSWGWGFFDDYPYLEQSGR